MHEPGSRRRCESGLGLAAGAAAAGRGRAPAGPLCCVRLTEPLPPPPPGTGFYDPEGLTEEGAVAVIHRALDLGVTLVRRRRRRRRRALYYSAQPGPR